jgi:hypothetical protein
MAPKKARTIGNSTRANARTGSPRRGGTSDATARKKAASTGGPNAGAGRRLAAVDNGVVVRMYRQGHGDCYLLAFPRETSGDPYYVLIDCGLKPGSQNFLSHRRPIGDFVQHIFEATGGRLDLVILTHEHQDHLNGIWKQNDPYFEPFDIHEAWLGWTEDPDNKLANALRKRHKDQLLGLVGARRELALAVGEDNPSVRRLDSLLSFELGGDTETLSAAALAAAAGDLSKVVNKQALKLVKDKAASNRGYYFLYPGGEPIELEGTTGVRAFVFGPPESEQLIADEDPQGDEAFPRDHGFSLVAAARASRDERVSPFSRDFAVPVDDALGGAEAFFSEHYGKDNQGENDRDREESTANASWRRIDNEWLFSAETLAIKLNTGINNTSVVLAFELPSSKKVLLFAGDAQRGNWYSWSKLEWKDGTETITARDLLARTVLYKVGHHGSHNATLSGQASDKYANLGWLGNGQFGGEFTAMINAVNEWAVTKNKPPWYHPLPSIRAALLSKAQGRVFQTDIGEPEQPTDVSDAAWKRFTQRATFDDLYFDYVIEDD